MIKSITQEDLPYIESLQPEGWSDINQAFQFYIQSPLCFPIKYDIASKPQAIGCGILLGETAWLAHLIVRPENRGRGLGYGLLSHICNDLQKKGTNSISLIATEMGYPLYKKFGFIDQEDYIDYQGETIGNKSFNSSISSFKREDTQEILTLDRKFSGETRNALLLPYLEAALVYRDREGIQGFYIPSLGEGLIVANNKEAGIELLKVKISRSTRVVFPQKNIPATELLKTMGFKEQRRPKRMILGEAFPWEPQYLYNRIGGNLG
ncbi:MAG: GNAT family N-acetyltransferase [Spirochaetaceae bacterium]|nr:GNAT family N-acetyltransferase [Spirochaetaceae bacterium]